MRPAVAWLAAASLLLSACAGFRVPPIGAGGRPFAPEADERALWARADAEESALLERVRAYEDAGLADYLGRLADRLTPDGVRAAGGPAFSVRVLRDPALNAFALPGGRVYLHTGLLSRLENEAQLAMIVAHEMVHVVQRHALSLERERAAVGVARARHDDPAAAGVAGRTARAILGPGLTLLEAAAIEGYGRHRERAADAGAVASLVRAGYDARAGAAVFARLGSESSDPDPLEPFFLGSRRRLAERVASTGHLLAGEPGTAPAEGGVRDTEEFQARMRPLVRDNAYEDLRAGRFARARRQLERVLAVTPGDPIAHTHVGHMHRLLAQRAREAAERAEHVRRALAAYDTAVALDATAPQPPRELGFLHYQEGDTARARAAFERYLALAPDAPDAGRIREYLVELGRGGRP